MDYHMIVDTSQCPITERKLNREYPVQSDAQHSSAANSNANRGQKLEKVM